MENKKKRAIIISTIVIASFIIIGLVYAVVTGSLDFTQKTTTGSVEIENLNLSFKKANGEAANLIQPADIDTISWTTKNIGTSAILTRHTLEIYWEDETEENAINLLYLYPANMSKEAMLNDYEKGEKSEYIVKTDKVSKEVDGKTLYGMKYSFVGDTLDGTDKVGFSKEINYNLQESEIKGIIDDNAKTDDESTTEDLVAFKLMLSPKTNYLYQGKKVSVKVTTEAMQYTEDGSAEWKVVSEQQI